MVCKVWACFYEEGDLKNVCIQRSDCISTGPYECERFVMKLIPVHSDISELEKAVNEFEKTAKDFDEVTKGFQTSSRRLKRSLDRYKI